MSNALEKSAIYQPRLIISHQAILNFHFKETPKSTHSYFRLDPAVGRKTLLLKSEKSDGTHIYSPSSVPGTKGILAAGVTQGWVYVLGSIIVTWASMVP